MPDMDRNNDRGMCLIGHLDMVCMVQVRSNEDRIQSVRAGTRDTCSWVGNHLRILAGNGLSGSLEAHQYGRLENNY